jgi:hypothetical protein
MVIRRKHLAGVALGSLVLGGVLMGLVAGIGTPGVRDRRIADAAEHQDMGLVRTLHWNDIATAEVLISEGANVNAVNQSGVSPLLLACGNGNATMVQALLDHGANANMAAASGETPLIRCVRSGRVDAVKILLANDAQVNAQGKEYGRTALMWAAAEKTWCKRSSRAMPTSTCARARASMR